MNHEDRDPVDLYEQAEREAVDRAYANAEPAPAEHPDDVSANARRAARMEEQRELAKLKHALHTSQRELQRLHVKHADAMEQLSDAEKSLRAYRSGETWRDERIAKLSDEVTSLLAVNDVLRAERDALRAEREERAA